MSQNLVALALRKNGAAPSLLERLRAVREEKGALGAGELRQVARAAGMPEAAVRGVATFYSDLLGSRGQRRVRACVGSACMAARGGRHIAELEQALGVGLGRASDDAARSLEPVHCLGHCHQGPAALVQEAGGAEQLYARLDSAGAERIARGAAPAAGASPEVVALCSPVIVLRNLVEGACARSLAQARARGVWSAYLAAAQAESGGAVLAEVLASQLRGRGGAGFPCGEKWRFVAAQPPGEKFIVCNADEGDPGAYLDRVLLEGDPHSVLEGMALAGLAVGAGRGVVYVRGEYPEAARAVRRAVEEVKQQALLPAFSIEVVDGAGSYVCGEETALLRSIEGLRGCVSARPPYPAVKGLFGRPTVVNNVETLINVPWIVAHGGEAYRRLGAGKSRGTKVVSLNERFVRPGVYEVELGTSLREICARAGGLRDGRKLKALQVGGPLAGLLPESLLDTALGFEQLEAVGGLLGHGGLVAYDESTDLGELALRLLEFGDAENCGKCFPCRLGMRRGLELVRSLREGRPPASVQPEGPSDPAGLLGELCETMRLGSLCGFGAGLPMAIESILRHFPGELLAPRGAEVGS